jgi:hypothetical protein
MTKKGNIGDYKVSIDYHSLPITFKDAIAITLKLEMSYLWIDALCIVQDDLDSIS